MREKVKTMINFARFKYVFIGLLLISGISPVHSIVPSFEHFPYGLLCALLFFRTNMMSVIAAGAIISFFTSSYVFYYIVGNDSELIYLIGFMNVISPLFFFRGNERLIGLVSRYVFWVYVFVGVLQYFYLLVPFEDIFELLISGFHGGWVGSGNDYRGVSMLETEPARASFQLIALYILAELLDGKQRISRFLALLVSQFVLIGATTGFFLTVTLVMFQLLKLTLKKPKIVPILFVGVCVMTPAGLNNPKVESAITMTSSEGLVGLHTSLAATSGGRYLGAVDSIQKTLLWPFGHGAESAYLNGEKKVVTGYQLEGYKTRVSSRPPSAPLNFAYVFGLPLTFLVLAAAIKLAKPSHISVDLILVCVIIILYSQPLASTPLLLLLAAFHATSFGIRRESRTPVGRQRFRALL